MASASLHAGADAAGKPCLYAVLGQESSAGHLLVLQVDPVSGSCRQFDGPPDTQEARSCLWSPRWRKLFMFAALRGRGCRLLAFDPARGAIESLDFADGADALLPVGVDEAADGLLYLGTHPDCGLTQYSPESRTFTRLGPMDADEQYLYPRCGDDGTVAALVKMARPHVVAFNPRTGAHAPVGPWADTNAQRGFVTLEKGSDGLLYIDSHEGILRVEGLRAVPVSSRPPPLPPPSLPDGTTFRFLDGHAEHRHTYRAIGLRHPDGSSRVIRLSYEAGGTGIYLVRTGPDGRLYGSSALPLHFFSADADGARLTDHGACSTASGQVYSMDSLDGKLYFCSYTHAILGVFDPARPYSFAPPVPDSGETAMGEHDPSWPCRFRFGAADNPRQLGRMDTVAYRPRDMLCGPAHKVWVGSVPDYGMWGGTLSWYDPATDSFGGAHRHIIPDCSPNALTWIPERRAIAIGFSIYGGCGTRPRANTAGFALWDPEADSLLWKGDLGIPITGVMDLEYAGGGLVYAVVHPAPADVLRADLLLIDLAAQRVVSRTRIDAAAGWPLEVSFQRDDAYLYGATRRAVYRVPLGTTRIDPLWQDDADGPTAAGALCRGGYCFASHHRLRRLEVPS